MNSAWLGILASLLKLAIWLVQTIEREKLKAEGRAEANEAANAEQRERIELAKAARADADALSADPERVQSEPDPYRRD